MTPFTNNLQGAAAVMIRILIEFVFPSHPHDQIHTFNYKFIFKTKSITKFDIARRESLSIRVSKIIRREREDIQLRLLAI